MNEKEELMKDAQQAYRAWQHVRGEYLPQWDELTPDDHEAWFKAILPARKIESRRMWDARIQQLDINYQQSLDI